MPAHRSPGISMPPLAHRFRAIDVLRGLTLALMIVVNMQIGPGRSYVPLLHAPWNGLTPTDVVFPTFLFVVGAALSFTLGKYAALGNAAFLRKVATRTALIFLCGYLAARFVREHGTSRSTASASTSKSSLFD